MVYGEEFLLLFINFELFGNTMCICNYFYVLECHWFCEHALHCFLSRCSLSALGRVALNLQNVMLYGSNGTPRLCCAFGGITAGLQHGSKNTGWGRGSCGSSVVLWIEWISPSRSSVTFGERYQTSSSILQSKEGNKTSNAGIQLLCLIYFLFLLKITVH